VAPLNTAGMLANVVYGEPENIMWKNSSRRAMLSILKASLIFAKSRNPVSTLNWRLETDLELRGKGQVC